MASFDRISVGRPSTARRKMRLGWLVVVVAAFAVPVAHADNWGASAPKRGGVSARPDDRAVGPRARAVTSIAAVRVDDRGGIRGVGSAHSPAVGATLASTTTRPDDRVGVRAFGPAPAVTAAAAVVPRVDNFQWGDAGIGAAIAVAAMMLLACIALAVLRSRATPRPVAP
jgi:hypothetical protein